MAVAPVAGNSVPTPSDMIVKAYARSTRAFAPVCRKRMKSQLQEMLQEQSTMRMLGIERADRFAVPDGFNAVDFYLGAIEPIPTLVNAM